MIDYRIFSAQQLIVICNWGKTSENEILQFSQNLRNDADFSQQYDIVLDNTQFEPELTSDEIYRLSKPRIDTNKAVGRIAVIAPEDLTYGMSRMHELISNMEKFHQICVFRDTESALEWLDRNGADIEDVIREIRGE